MVPALPSTAPDVGLKLMQILMGDGESHPVLTQFGPHVRHREW
jgi:hypothetical protein